MQREREGLRLREGGGYPREAAAVYKLPTMSVDSGWRFSRLPSIPLRIVSSEQSADARAPDTEVAFDINVVLLSPLKSNPSPTRQRASLSLSLLSLSFPLSPLLRPLYAASIPPPSPTTPPFLRTRENVRSFSLIMHSQVAGDGGSVRACTITSTTGARCRLLTFHRVVLARGRERRSACGKGIF